MSDLTLLVLADVHFRQAAEPLPSGGMSDSDLGAELVQRAILDARRSGGFDALVLLGDLLDAGAAPGADRDLAVLEEVIHKTAGDVPRIVLPGNHDRDPALTLSIFGDAPGLHEVKGYRLYSFLDVWDDDDVGSRPAEAMDRFEREARPGGGKPLIAIQHNVLHPPIDDEYPYALQGREAVMSAYARAGVALSLSGHYHAGQPLSEAGGVRYYTCPAICREPYRYALVRVRGREVSVSERQLRLPDGLRLFDVHTHTQYAYCGDDVSAAEVIRRARAFGLAGVCLTEHADQLYLAREEHAACHVYRDNDYWCAPRSAESERMPRYRRDVEPLRSDFVRLGLEIELDGLGRPAVRPSDLAGWDLLIGAVHWIPGGVEGRSLDEVQQAFMVSAQKLLASGVHVLAHPFRFFGRNRLGKPRHLYRPLARLLAQHGVAAEINFHTNEPDPEFFAECIREGVRIALGSDAHELREVADLQPHLALLREAAGRNDVADLLWPVTAV